MADALKALPITIRKLTKRYGSFTALDEVNLDIATGEFLTLLGPSGSGKTTLLMVLAGFVRPDAGGGQFRRRGSIAETTSPARGWHGFPELRPVSPI